MISTPLLTSSVFRYQTMNFMASKFFNSFTEPTNRISFHVHQQSETRRANRTLWNPKIAIPTGTLSLFYLFITFFFLYWILRIHLCLIFLFFYLLWDGYLLYLFSLPLFPLCCRNWWVNFRTLLTKVILCIKILYSNYIVSF